MVTMACTHSNLSTSDQMMLSTMLLISAMTASCLVRGTGCTLVTCGWKSSESEIYALDMCQGCHPAEIESWRACCLMFDRLQ